ncbi:MAG: phosphoribosylformylglycinamidine synthase subunit PurQ, partial [Peptostreptococcaceae bacterium]|nr:phosphoribosylformylglycinamidine synthase subunit PurQ [Peptostreptococcaceae bacterium]
RRNEATKLIKKCNDFGAGGISVAIGELADSLDVNLDLVLKKYEGLDGTELAISESQERMAVVVENKDVNRFLALAESENIEAVAVARVTNTGRFRMFWKGKMILDLSRDFLNTNGVKQHTKVLIKNSLKTETEEKGYKNPLDYLDDLNCCSQKGLIEKFDSTIGAGTVMMPLGGKFQLSPSLGMIAKLPITEGETDTATLMTYGFDPLVSSVNPFHGALYAVIDSVTKQVAMGSEFGRVRLTFQEYFERLGSDTESWGLPFATLLGALKVQKELSIPAIGGKDSMSGTFMDINVPPTLISFAVSVIEAKNTVTSELKFDKSHLIYMTNARDENGIIDFNQYKINMSKISELIKKGNILATNTIGQGGIFVSAVKMAIGNKIGAALYNLDYHQLCEADYGALILQVSIKEDIEKIFKGTNYKIIGNTTDGENIDVEYTGSNQTKLSISLDEAIKRMSEPLENIFPTRTADFKENRDTESVETFSYEKRNTRGPLVRIAKPQILIPAFPGTNCEMDSKRAFVKAGGNPFIHIIRNLSEKQLIESIDELEKRIRESQIIMIPGGFSGGDEPDGSAKFITAVFRNPKIMEAVKDLLENRDGLMLGICNGFQALIKLGLVPYGTITEANQDSPTLTYNKIGRHMSCLIQTRIASVKSPWLAGVQVGDIYTLPVSHGEGRFIGSEKLIRSLAENGQIATQYVDFEGKPSMDISFNPNYSAYAIEGITSEDGRVFGKMAHSERIGQNLYKNVPGHFDQKIFESGVNYFK